MRGLPRRRDLKIRRNQAGQIVVAWTDLNGTPIPLSSYGFRAMIRGRYDDLNPVVSLSLGSGFAIGTGTPLGTNVFVMTWTAAQATAIANTFGRGVWDMYLDPSGVSDSTSILALQGQVIVENTATR